MDEIEIRTRRMKYIAHGPTQIEVIYTNGIKQVEDTLEELKSLQRGVPVDEEFMGLDFEYTKEDPKKHKKVVVVQLCVNRTVLVYQLARWEMDLLVLISCSRMVVTTIWF